jgi:hypothetical protein
MPITSWGARFRSGATAGIALAFLIVVDARGVYGQRSADVKSSEPLRLTLAPSQTEVHVSEGLTIELRLTNTSSRPVGGCARAWEDYIIFGIAGTHSGRTWVDDGIPPENLFLVPPGHVLSWRLTIDLARLQSGQAELLASFTSDCPGGTSLARGVLMWRGRVSSAPVTLTILE